MEKQVVLSEISYGSFKSVASLTCPETNVTMFELAYGNSKGDSRILYNTLDQAVNDFHIVEVK